MAYTGSTAAILSNYDEVLKTFYLPAIQEQLNDATTLSKMIDVNEEDVSGKNATIECHYGRSNGVGARADGGLLPDPDYQKFKTATVPTKYNYGRITFSGPTIAATRDQRGAYARVIDTEVSGMITDMKKEVNRQLWGCGYGILARWRSTASGTSYTVQKAYTGNTAGGDGFGSTFGAKYLTEFSSAVPVVLSSMSSASAATYTVDATNIAVSAVDDSVATYDTITVTDPSVTEAAGTFYVRPASLGAATTSGGQRLEMMGLRGIVTDTDLDEIAANDGTDTGLLTANNDGLQGLDVSTYSWWKANVDSAATRYGSQRALTLTLMQKMFDKIEIKAGEGVGPDLIMTTHALRREYLELTQADRRFVNEKVLDGGNKVLDYNDTPFMVDIDAIDGEIYFLTTSDLQIYRMSDYDWMSKDGAVLSRIGNYDAYEAVLFRYAELGCKRRNTQGVITDLAYDN